MGSYDDDSTGKGKIVEAKARYTVLASFFAVGVCVGIVISERVYVSHRSEMQPRQLISRIENVIHHRHVPSGQVTATTASGPAGQATSAQGYGAEGVGASGGAAPRNDLEAMLMKIAPQREVLVAVSNKNTLWDMMLATFTDGIKRAGVTNHLILALDEDTKRWCEVHDINVYLMNLTVSKVQQGTGDNHAVSAMKFGILRQFVELGWSVLLSDVDICIFKNPFEHLYRDSDVEGMTDGFDDPTAYGEIGGFDDPSMGWGRYAQLYKHFNLNSGLFYLRANNRTVELMTRLANRLSHQQYWDQTAYNEEIFFLSHGAYKSPQVSVRVMEIDKFMNSKRLFKDVRKRPRSQRPEMPVMVHINYHPVRLIAGWLIRHTWSRQISRGDLETHCRRGADCG